MTTTQRVPPSTEAPPRRGSVLGLTLLVVLAVGAALASLAIGSRDIPIGEVLGALLYPDGSDISTIVNGLRVPRTALGLLAGAALGLAGALMQGHTRNPLADPGLLGVNAGAAFAVVIGVFAFGVTSLAGYAWFALAGAGLAAAAVFAIGSSRGGPNPVSLVLAGAAVSALLIACTQAVVLTDRATLNQWRFWQVGSVANRGLDVVAQVAPFLVAGAVLAAISSRSLNLLQLGDDVARSLGIRPTRAKVIGIAAVMLLVGATTAACGPISFVGLVVPHLARFLAGVDYRWILVYSTLLGAILVTAGDILGRLMVRPAELQVGIVMALIGGPVFVLLVRRARLVKL
ncbi:iron chelate uptake ABC transporter family permease subunit [Naumannella cuiyingiana]|uniref:Iron complex transport system permease protein n=1 Tax=Naumannella cuiyingiana TaxID=1347891 RepID=A0A7Z0D8I8_9ACTN|nr:iron complex transport system permease protein [Naumannella cuiyingiana]